MTTLIIFFIALLLFYLLFLLKVYKGLYGLKPAEGTFPEEFVTVIIPFRNESGNILKSLQSIEAQNYPTDRHEVLYVDDHSTDTSMDLLCKTKRKNNIKIFSLTNGVGKKKAVEFGISNSRGEIIVTTDADCLHKPDWLATLLNHFDPGTGMVAGTVEMKEGRTVFQKMQRVEFAGLVTVGAGLIGAGDPYICNAANLAYRKKIFHQLGGFTDNIHLASGDDEFLMQKIHSETGYKIKFCHDQEAIVTTYPNKNLSQFFNQRKRWGSKGLFYKDKVKVVTLSLIFLFYLSLLMQIFLSFFSAIYFFSFISSILIKITAEYLVMRKASEILFDRNILKSFFLTEILHIPYIVIVSVAGAFGGLKWKSRKMYR